MTGCGRKIGPYECCTVVCGDCLELMKALPDGCVDAVITDPPYMGLAGGTKLSSSTKAHGPMLRDAYTLGDIWNASLAWFPDAWRVASKALFAFCSYHFVSELGMLAPMERACLLTWYKRNTSLSVHNVPRFDCEFIWAFRKAPGPNWKSIKSLLLDEPRLSTGTCASPERITDEFKRAVHPTQKPESVTSVLILDGLETILDPFLGSGTTAVAAKKLGQHFLGFEINPDYCRIAEERIALVEMQPQLFGRKPEQVPLITEQTHG